MVSDQQEERPIGAAVTTVAGSLCLLLAALLAFANYGAGRGLDPSRMHSLFSAASPAHSADAAKRDGLRVYLPAEPRQGNKARTLDPPDLFGCSLGLLPLPAGCAPTVAHLDPDFRHSGGPAAFQPRAPPISAA